MWRPKKPRSVKKVSFAVPLVQIFGEEYKPDHVAHPTQAVLRQELPRLREPTEIDQELRADKIMQMIQAATSIDRGEASPVQENILPPPVIHHGVNPPELAHHFERPLTKGKAEAIDALAQTGKLGKEKKKKRAAGATVVPTSAESEVA